MELFDKLKKIIAETASVDEDSITRETSFKDDLGLDSLDLMEIVMACEEYLGTTIEDEDLQGIETVGDAIDAFSK